MYQITYYDKQLWKMIKETFQDKRQAKAVLMYRKKTTDKLATMEKING